MARLAKPLSQVKIDQTKPSTKVQRLTDGQVPGLVLTIHPSGRRVWLLRYTKDGKPTFATLGDYGPAPLLTLATARQKARATRVDIDGGKDPVLVKKQRKAAVKAQLVADTTTFREVGDRWYAKVSNKWSAQTYRDDVRSRMERVLYPDLGDMPINNITPRMVLQAIQKRADHSPILQQYARATASRIFRFGIAHQECENDAAAPITEGLETYVRGSCKTPGSWKPLKKESLQDFLTKLDELDDNDPRFPTTFAVKRLVKLTAVCFLRATEMRNMQWSQIDLKRALWVLPRDAMKQTRVHKNPDAELDHVVPLPRQAVVMLRELQQRRVSEWVFPGFASKGRKPVEHNATNNLIERIGYKGKTSGHGFRKLASTLLHEARPRDHDLIEEALAHAKKGIGGVYNLAQYIEPRRELMQLWANMLDQYRTRGIGGNVHKLGSARRAA